MGDNQKTLENLLVDEQKIGEEILHDLLSDYIRIGKQSGDLIPQEEFDQLAAKQKVIIVLLTQRARHELEMVKTEWLTPKEISQQSGVKQGTVHPTVRELNNESLIESGDGSYRIPSHSIRQAREFVDGSENDE